MDSLCWRRSPSAVDHHDTGVGRLDQSLKAKVVMTGMASDEAKSMLADIMNLDVLRPKIEASEIAKMLESRNRMNLYYTHRDYSPPPVDDC